MNGVISCKSFPPPQVCVKEALRYAGCKAPTDELSALLNECMAETEDKLTYRVCWRELPFKADGELCDFGAFRVNSRGLAQNLAGCEQVIVFAATVGVGIDRLISRYGRLSPAKALMLQALGAERIEALCDAFCASIENELCSGTRPRFSPGYGDLPLSCQKEIFAVLDCERKIGLTLNESLLMSPSKSVTAFMGLCQRAEDNNINKCAACNLRGCEFRSKL